MNASALDMLRKLASGVVPDGSTLAVSRGGANTLSGQGSTGSLSLNFANFLQRAVGGQARSNLPVSINEKLGLSLSQDQMVRLSRAADKAESEGFATAVVSIDGVHLMLDVQGRRITSVVDSAGPAVSGIDGFVIAPASELPAPPPPAQVPGAAAPAPPAPVLAQSPLLAQSIPSSTLYARLASLTAPISPTGRASA